jgi:hypothetical protein
MSMTFLIMLLRDRATVMDIALRDLRFIGLSGIRFGGYKCIQSGTKQPGIKRKYTSN